MDIIALVMSIGVLIFSIQIYRNTKLQNSSIKKSIRINKINEFIKLMQGEPYTYTTGKLSLAELNKYIFGKEENWRFAALALMVFPEAEVLKCSNLTSRHSHVVIKLDDIYFDINGTYTYEEFSTKWNEAHLSHVNNLFRSNIIPLEHIKNEINDINDRHIATQIQLILDQNDDYDRNLYFHDVEDEDASISSVSMFENIDKFKVEVYFKGSCVDQVDPILERWRNRVSDSKKWLYVALVAKYTRYHELLITRSNDPIILVGGICYDYGVKYDKLHLSWKLIDINNISRYYNNILPDQDLQIGLKIKRSEY